MDHLVYHEKMLDKGARVRENTAMEKQMVVISPHKIGLIFLSDFPDFPGQGRFVMVPTE
jgi:hypothetical protein